MKTLAGVLLSIAMLISAEAAQRQDEVGSAIDVKGVHYVARRPTGMPQWIADAVFRPKPDYPYEERRLRNEGRAVIRLEIDLKTGVVTNAILVQSSGFPKLDEAAL